jgi:hypothetical protein
MTTNMPGDPKTPVILKTSKGAAPINFAHYETILVPSAKTAPRVWTTPTVSAVSRSATPPTSYIDPERLMGDVAQLYAAHDRIFSSLDVLDAASRNAGTPIRSGSSRERFAHLFGVIREAETIARKSWQDELIASNGANLTLTRALAAGAKNDALHVTKLTRKDANRPTPDGHTHIDDPDRTSNNTPSDHNDRFDTPIISGNLNPNALALKPRTAFPKLFPVRPFGYSLSTADLVRGLLKDGGWGTDRITHGELIKLVALFNGATAADAEMAISELSDSELKLIADDMDSNGIGNYEGLSTNQKESFIAKLATQLDAKQFVRVAKAFDDDVEIASVLARTPNTGHLTTGFIAYCESKFIAAGSEEGKRSAALAVAVIAADLTPEQLAAFLTKYSSKELFLSQVFSEACGYTQTPVYSYDLFGTRTTRIIHRFEPSLLERINATALKIPTANEPARFEIFKRTIMALEWMKATSTDSADDKAIKKVLLVATASAQVDLASHIDANSPDRSFFTSWIRLLLQSNETNQVKESLLAVAKASPGNYEHPGYLIGIVVRAANDIDRNAQDSVNLAYDVVSALLNAVPVGGQIAGEILKTAASTIGEASKSSSNIGDLLFAGMESTLKGPAHKAQRKQLLDGFLAGIGSAVATRHGSL